MLSINIIRRSMFSCSSPSLVTGTVRSFVDNKGFGFIQGDDGSDVFVHYTNIMGDGFKKLQPGQKVKFDVRAGRDGKQEACNVTNADGSSIAAPPRSH